MPRGYTFIFDYLIKASKLNLCDNLKTNIKNYYVPFEFGVSTLDPEPPKLEELEAPLVGISAIFFFLLTTVTTGTWG